MTQGTELVEQLKTEIPEIGRIVRDGNLISFTINEKNLTESDIASIKDSVAEFEDKTNVEIKPLESTLCSVPTYLVEK